MTTIKGGPGTLFAAFGEALLVLDDSRRVCLASSNTASVLGIDATALDQMAWRDVLAKAAAPECITALDWAVEALFEDYISSAFIPPRFPLKSKWSISFAALNKKQVAVRIQACVDQEHDTFLSTYLRPALTSTTGFTDVILKGIDGPVTDLQLEDLNVISRDAQFALELVQDYRAQFVWPSLRSPVPLLLEDLLRLDNDDIPRGRINSRGLSITVQPTGDLKVYSNGALRQALIDIVRLLVPCVVPHSEIAISHSVINSDSGLIGVCITYQTTDSSMLPTKHIEPVELVHRRETRGASRLMALVTSLHAQLSPFGCTACAEPDPAGVLSRIMMTVPRWSGPLAHQ